MVTSRFLLRVVNNRASSVGPPICLKLHRSIYGLHCNIITSNCVKSTKTPRLWQKPTSNTMCFGYGGCPQHPSLRKVCMACQSGWGSSIITIDNGGGVHMIIVNGLIYVGA